MLKKGEVDSTTNVKISLIIYYTKEFKASTADVEGYVEGLIETTNIAFLRSQIPVQLVVHCILQSEIGEAPDSTDRIRAFKQSRGQQNYKPYQKRMVLKDSEKKVSIKFSYKIGITVYLLNMIFHQKNLASLICHHLQ